MRADRNKQCMMLMMRIRVQTCYIVTKYHVSSVVYGNKAPIGKSVVVISHLFYRVQFDQRIIYIRIDWVRSASPLQCPYPSPVLSVHVEMGDTDNHLSSLQRVYTRKLYSIRKTY